MFKEGDKVILTKDVSPLRKGSVVKFHSYTDHDKTSAEIHVPSDNDANWWAPIDSLKAVNDSRLFPRKFQHEYVWE